jgi:hypothetical protein
MLVIPDSPLSLLPSGPHKRPKYKRTRPTNKRDNHKIRLIHSLNINSRQILSIHGEELFGGELECFVDLYLALEKEDDCVAAWFELERLGAHCLEVDV